MAREAARVLADELHRILDEFRRVTEEVERALAERKRLATIAHRMMQILRTQARGKVAERLIAELGLDDVIARLPGLPGRKATPAPARKPGRRATAATGEARRQRKALTRAAAAAEAAPEVLPKGTAVRMLTGKYAKWSGVIRWNRVHRSIATYTVHLTGPKGQDARTQVSHRSIGTSWTALEQPSAAIGTPSSGAVPRRRRGGKVVSGTAPVAKPVQAPPPPPAAKAPAPQAAGPSLPAGVLPKKTPIRMLAGIYLGYTGEVAYVQAKSGPRPDAIYTLNLTGPGGEKARTSVKQGSLGRTWTKIA